MEDRGWKIVRICFTNSWLFVDSC